MKQNLLALTTTVVLAAALSACGSDSDDSSSSAAESSATPTGPLAGSEFGLADGSTTEVPLDPSVVASGPQDSLTTPASVIASGITPDAQEIEFVAELEIIDVVQGDIADFELDAESLETVGDAVPYYVAYEGRYVNGPVAQQPDLANFDIVDASGQSLDSGVQLVMGSVTEDVCQGTFKAESFGEGAEMRHCALRFLEPGEPAAVTWTYEPESVPAGEPVSWPLG
ncbi:hypothetical protein ACOACO_07520 [Nocardioides sp. CPCC 205120]|uniref:hypothetical protein n=1 Tax=Nocardioides sp. CPCC 205120 TaxID=3406462 RepID=UPI003B5122B4